MIDQTLRIVVFAPHFAEYSTRLALALSERARVLLITERRNLQVECQGLSTQGLSTQGLSTQGLSMQDLPMDAATPRLTRASYASDLALRRLSPRGFLESRRIRRAIAAFKPDVMHIQEQGDRFTAAIADTFAPSLPIVLTVHDPVPHSGSDTLVAKRFAPGLLRLREVASAYHVHGAHCEALLRDRLGTAKPIAATAHGVILVPPAGPVEGGDRYLFFGRMEAYKGLDTLLDAIDLVPEALGARFVLAGRGPELERHRERIAAQPRIELVDRFLPPLEAIRQFQRARVVLVPYRDATQSGVVSAAFGNGKPVIATRVGGLADAVADGTSGIVVPPDDPVALAGAIRAMADAPTCDRLAAGARAAATGRFAWSAVATRLHDLYAELIAARHG